jgi:nucleotidyltransferase/DNA polymerase involved in DNA repair
LAKLAGAVNKPNQQTTLFSRSTLEFVTSLRNARVIPGIGSSTFKILESKGLSSVKDIQESSMDFLNSFLGSLFCLLSKVY